MSNRVKNADAALELLDKIEFGLDYAVDYIDDLYVVAEQKISALRTKVAVERDNAATNQAADEAREQKAREIVDKVVNLFKNPQVKSFYDAVVNPVVEPVFSEAPHTTSPNGTDGPTREDKIKYIKDFYRDKYNLY